MGIELVRDSGLRPDAARRRKERARGREAERAMPLRLANVPRVIPVRDPHVAILVGTRDPVNGESRRATLRAACDAR